LVARGLWESNGGEVYEFIVNNCGLLLEFEVS